MIESGMVCGHMGRCSKDLCLKATCRGPWAIDLMPHDMGYRPQGIDHSLWQRGPHGPWRHGQYSMRGEAMEGTA